MHKIIKNDSTLDENDSLKTAEKASAMVDVCCQVVVHAMFQKLKKKVMVG